MRKIIQESCRLDTYGTRVISCYFYLECSVVCNCSLLTRVPVRHESKRKEKGKDNVVRLAWYNRTPKYAHTHTPKGETAERGRHNTLTDARFECDWASEGKLAESKATSRVSRPAATDQSGLSSAQLPKNWPHARSFTLSFVFFEIYFPPYLSLIIYQNRHDHLSVRRSHLSGDGFVGRTHSYCFWYDDVPLIHFCRDFWSILKIRERVVLRFQ